MWITGRHAVEELLASSRQKAVRLLLSDAAPPEARKALAGSAAALGIPCRTAPREEWELRTGDKGGQGVAAELGEFRYEDLRAWLSNLPGRAVAFLLDGITDPQNFGAILRNARAFGMSGVVVPRDRSCPVTPAVFRASAGAAAHVPVLLVPNLARAIGELKDAGFWLYAAEGDGETEVSDLAAAARTGIVLGSEGRGIRRLVRDVCDGTVRIGIERGVESLNVSVAAGILGYCMRKTLTSSR